MDVEEDAEPTSLRSFEDQLNDPDDDDLQDLQVDTKHIYQSPAASTQNCSTPDKQGDSMHGVHNVLVQNISSDTPAAPLGSHNASIQGSLRNPTLTGLNRPPQNISCTESNKTSSDGMLGVGAKIKSKPTLQSTPFYNSVPPTVSNVNDEGRSTLGNVYSERRSPLENVNKEGSYPLGNDKNEGRSGNKNRPSKTIPSSYDRNVSTDGEKGVGNEQPRSTFRFLQQNSTKDKDHSMNFLESVWSSLSSEKLQDPEGHIASIPLVEKNLPHTTSRNHKSLYISQIAPVINKVKSTEIYDTGDNNNHSGERTKGKNDNEEENVGKFDSVEVNPVLEDFKEQTAKADALGSIESLTLNHMFEGTLSDPSICSTASSSLKPVHSSEIARLNANLIPPKKPDRQPPEKLSVYTSKPRTFEERANIPLEMDTYEQEVKHMHIKGQGRFSNLVSVGQGHQSGMSYPNMMLICNCHSKCQGCDRGSHQHSDQANSGNDSSNHDLHQPQHTQIPDQKDIDMLSSLGEILKGGCGSCAMCKSHKIGENLERLAVKEGYLLHDVPPDGNCMFRAIIDQMRMQGEGNITAVKLRRKAVEYLRDHPYAEDGTHIEVFLTSESWDEYLARMRRNSEWGDEIMLRSIADMLGKRIVILSAFEGNQHSRIEIMPTKKSSVNQSEDSSVNQSEDIILGHVTDAHYVSLRRKDWKESWYKIVKQDEIKTRQVQNRGSVTLDFTSNNYMERQQETLFDPCNMIDGTSSVPVSYITFIMSVLLLPLDWQEREGKEQFFQDSISTLKSRMGGRAKIMLVGSKVEDLDISLASLYGNALTRKSESLPSLPNIMLLTEDLKIATKQQDMSNSSFVLDTSGVHTGYARVHCPCHVAVLSGSYEQLNGRSYWNHAMFSRRTGPSHSEFSVPGVNSKMFTVSCLQEWPGIATSWITRRRPSGWPDQTTVKKAIQNFGCVLSPVAHKNSLHPNVEFMFCFSVAQNIITKTLTRHQKKVYYMFKILLDFHINDLLGNLSYLLRTIFFYSCEAIPKDLWERHPGAALLYLLDRLICDVTNRCLPHYFIPENNLIDHVSYDVMNKLESRLKVIRSSPCLSICLCAEEVTSIPVWIIDRVMWDIPEFINLPDLKKSCQRLFLPVVEKWTRYYLGFELHSQAANIMHKMFGCIQLILSGQGQIDEDNYKDLSMDNEQSKTKVQGRRENDTTMLDFIQGILNTVTVSQRWNICFLLDSCHGHNTLEAFTDTSDGDVQTLGEILHTKDLGGLTQAKLPYSVVVDNISQNVALQDCRDQQIETIKFLDQLAYTLFIGKHYDICALMLRGIHNHIKQEIGSISTSNETRSTSQKPAAMQLHSPQYNSPTSMFQLELKFQHYATLSLSVLVHLWTSYVATKQPELFSEYIHDLEFVCDLMQQSSSYAMLASIWQELGDAAGYNRAVQKQQNTSYR